MVWLQSSPSFLYNPLQPAMGEGRKRGCWLGHLGLRALRTLLVAPHPADLHAATFCPHRAPLSVFGGCGVKPFLSCQAQPWGWTVQPPEHTQVGVWSDATQLASGHVFQASQTPLAGRCCLPRNHGQAGVRRGCGFASPGTQVPTEQQPGTT